MTSSWLERMLEIISHPELHARELPLIMALVTFVVLAIIIFFYLTYQRKYSASLPTDIKLRSAVVYLAASLIVFILFMIVPLLYLTSNRSCLNCHTEKGIHREDMEYYHRVIDCEQCHTLPGISGKLATYFKLTGKIFNLSITGSRLTPYSCCVPPEVCSNCHEKALNSTLVNQRIKISHKEFISVIPDCSTCHVFQKSAVRLVSPLSVMSRCGECHDNKTAPAACGYCHTPYGNTPAFRPLLDDYPKVTVKEEGVPVLEGKEPTPVINIEDETP